MDRGLLGRLHSLDEHPNGAARGPAGGLYALVVAKPHDSQLVRWNDHHLLAAHAGHEIHVLGRRPGTIAVHPEQSTVLWAIVRHPRRRERADEVRVTLRENPRPVPDAILHVADDAPRH